MIEEHTRYSVKCDYCGKEFMDELGEELFDSEADAEYQAECEDWVITENAGEDVKHFCCTRCCEEYKELKGGKA